MNAMKALTKIVSNCFPKLNYQASCYNFKINIFGVIYMFPDSILNTYIKTKNKDKEQRQRTKTKNKDKEYMFNNMVLYI